MSYDDFLMDNDTIKIGDGWAVAGGGIDGN